MALKDTDINAEYPYFFFVEESIHQQERDNIADDPIYTLSLVWKRYKVETDGAMVMDDNSQQSYYDENFYTTAATKAAQGDMSDYDTLTAQTLSVKNIIEAETGVTLAVE